MQSLLNKFTQSFVKDKDSYILQKSIDDVHVPPVFDTIQNVKQDNTPVPAIPSSNLNDVSFLLAHPSVKHSIAFDETDVTQYSHDKHPYGNTKIRTDGKFIDSRGNAILYNNQTIQYSPIFESIYKYMGLSKDDINARLLGSLFFRQSNVDILQDTLIRETYVQSGNKFIIKKQKQEHVINAMQKQFIRYGQYLPCRLKEQIEQLNRRVIKSIIPGIISNCIAHYNVENKYGKNQLGLMDRPERTFNNYKPLVVENERFDVFLQPDYDDDQEGGGGIGGGIS